MGAHEIGALLGVSRQRVQQLIAAKTFPAPLATLAMGKVWLAEDVERWARERGRVLRQSGQGSPLSSS